MHSNSLPQIAWQASATINTLKQRASILSLIRQFFAQKDVLEVETPSLSRFTITDPYLQALETHHTEPGATKSTCMYLQTSPEYAMKRLLASGSGDIFQIAKAFRDDEVGRFHNPEFTMLEWYRLNFSMQDLMDEVAQLLMLVLPIQKVDQFTYRDVFLQYCKIDPITASIDEIIALCNSKGLDSYMKSIATQLCDSSSKHDVLLRDSALQILFNQEIEPYIGHVFPVMVSHFPASQAALSQLTNDGLCANRFEVYFKGVELANGFLELQDPHIQAQRFAQDNQKRQALGLSPRAIDTHFMAALQAGLPACSGVALGIDRLIMLALNKSHIQEVIAFNHANC